MGATGSVLSSPMSVAIKEDSFISQGEDDDMTSNVYHNTLRLTILENIRLEFQRPTHVILYGCPYGCVDFVTQALSKKLAYEVFKCEVGKPSLECDLDEFFSRPLGSRKYGYIFQNFPQTFDQMLSLQSFTNSSQPVVIFLNCSYAGIIKTHQLQWIHPESGRTYHVIDQPPKSMEGTVALPTNMFDDLTNEPLVQRVTREQCIRELMAYDKMKIEMWSQWLSFRHSINADIDKKSLEHELVKLLCRIISDQSSGQKRVFTSRGIKVQSVVGVG